MTAAIRTGPALPGETREEYIARVVSNAGRPTDEQVAQLAALLRYGSADGERETALAGAETALSQPSSTRGDGDDG